MLFQRHEINHIKESIMIEYIKLKNCPFCNDCAVCEKVYCYTDEIEYHKVACIKCFCQTDLRKTKESAIRL